jgi:single-stranded DNA-binding protein
MKNKQMLYFILENSFECKDRVFKSFIPCVVWGNLADDIDRLNIDDCITIKGYLRSRTYNKTLEDGSKTEKIAYECYVTSFTEATEDERSH